MILANEAFAQTLSDANVPCVFRVQNPPRTEDEANPMRIPVRVSTTPGPHATLGVSLYCQATSPLRRYADLLIQRQLGAALATAPPPYDTNTIAWLVNTTEQALHVIRLIERWSIHYWSLVHLRERQDHPIVATILERTHGKWYLHLDEFGLVVTGSPLPSSKWTTGDQVTLRITEVNPRRDLVRIMEVPTRNLVKEDA